MQEDDLARRHREALVLGFNEDFKGSLSALRSLISDYPDNLDVLYDYAMTQMMLGQHDDACAKLKEILLKDPAHEKALRQATYC